MRSLSEPDSRYGRRARSSLNTSNPPHSHRRELGRIVKGTKPGGVHHEAQNLRVGPGRPAGKPVEEKEHEDSTEEGVEEVKYRRAHQQRKEEKLSLDAHDREGTVERAENGIGSSRHDKPHKDD